MQLSETNIRGEILKLVFASLPRLLVAPLVAFLVVMLLQVKGMPAKILVLQTSTPTAVMALVYAIRFKNNPDFVAGSVLVSTLLSMITLGLLVKLVLNFI